MTAISISTNLQAALEVAQFVRNGRAPTSDIQNRLATMAGYAAYVDSKMIFRSAGQLCSGGSSLVLDSVATRPRWRFAFHTGPYAWYLMTRLEIAPQNNGTPTDPYCELRIYNTSGTQVGVCTIHGGSSDGSYADVPINMTGGVGLVLNPSDLGSIADLDPDTEYTGVFWDVGYARLQSAAVWEISLNPDTDNGYAPNNLGTGGPIYSSHRNDVAAMARLLHKRSGTPVFHWCSNVDSAAPSQAGATSQAVASMTLGALTLSSTGTLDAGATVDSTLGALTLSSTGTTTATLSYTASMSPDPVDSLATLTGTISVVVGGSAQTNLSATFYVNDSHGHMVTLTGQPTNTATDGFTVTWTDIGTNQWACEITRATASVTTYTVQFQCNAYRRHESPQYSDVGVTFANGQSTEVPTATTVNDYAVFT